LIRTMSTFRRTRTPTIPMVKSATAKYRKWVMGTMASHASRVAGCRGSAIVGLGRRPPARQEMLSHPLGRETRIVHGVGRQADLSRLLLALTTAPGDRHRADHRREQQQRDGLEREQIVLEDLTPHGIGRTEPALRLERGARG